MLIVNLVREKEERQEVERTMETQGGQDENNTNVQFDLGLVAGQLLF